MDKFTNNPPSLHSDHAADNFIPLQEVNGLQMRPNKENKNQDENTGTLIVCNAATNIAVAVSYHLPKNNSYSKSNTNLPECSAGNEDDDASNVPLATNNERPVSLELQPVLAAHGSAQQQRSEFNMITTTPVATPVEDITSHVTSDSSYQSWYSDGSGQIISHDPPNQLKTETNNIMTFHAELSADMYQYWNTSSHGCPHANAVPPSMLQVPLTNPVQESCGQSDPSRF